MKVEEQEIILRNHRTNGSDTHHLATRKRLFYTEEDGFRRPELIETDYDVKCGATFDANKHMEKEFEDLEEDLPEFGSFCKKCKP